MLLTGHCSPGACSPKTEEVANTFRRIVSEKYPQLYRDTVAVLEEQFKLLLEMETIQKHVDTGGNLNDFRE